MTKSDCDRDSRPDHIVVLIHGTWARNAGWTRAGSPMRRLIEAGLAPASVKFVTPQWPGWNRSLTRTAAVRNIASECGKVPGWTTARRHVIAHSHAGNIALQVAKDPSVELMGVAFLSTPFLHGTAGNMPESLIQAAHAAMALIPGAFLALLLLPVSIALQQLPLWIRAVLWYGVLYVAFWLCRSVFRTLERFQKRVAGWLLRQMDTSSQRPLNLLIIRSAGDEQVRFSAFPISSPSWSAA